MKDYLVNIRIEVIEKERAEKRQYCFFDATKADSFDFAINEATKNFLERVIDGKVGEIK